MDLVSSFLCIILGDVLLWDCAPDARQEEFGQNNLMISMLFVDFDSLCGF
jgi:hypothetical protein